MDWTQGAAMKKAPAAFLAVFFIPVVAGFPQSSFLKKGQSGIGLTGAYVTSSSATGFTGTAGFGLGGVFDLSIGVGRAAVDDSPLADLEAKTFEPQITVHALKQNSSTSWLSLSFSAGYARDNYSSPDLDAVSFTMWSESFLIGATIYRDVPLGSKLYLQPFVGGGFANTTLKIRNADGLTARNQDDVWSLSAGLPLVYGFSGRALLVVEPGLVTNKNATTFTAALSLVYIVKAGK
jgi:hypothetical protein